jgi:hypothetical protein
MEKQEEKREILLKRFNLAKTKEYAEILQELTNWFIGKSPNLDEKLLKGQVQLVRWLSNWEADYNDYMKANKK